MHFFVRDVCLFVCLSSMCTAIKGPSAAFFTAWLSGNLSLVCQQSISYLTTQLFRFSLILAAPHVKFHHNSNWDSAVYVNAVFNTDTNHSVVQTYNFTTYNLCDYDDALDSDTKIWSAADPSNTATIAVTIAVPLLKEGTTYFFSSDYDGDQCNNGQRFKIYVSHGKGLPDSLKSPSEQAPAPNSPDYNNDDSAPDIVVPSNFSSPEDGDHKDDDNVKKASRSVSLYARKVNSFMVLLGLVCIFVWIALIGLVF